MKKYLKKTLEYAVGNTFNKFLLILLLPLFTKFMAPEEYAVYTNFMIFSAFFSLIYILGMQQALFSYFYFNKTKEYQYSIISSIFMTLFVVGIILSLLIIFFRTNLSKLIVRTELYETLLIWMSFIIFCDVIYGMTLQILNIMEKSTNYVLLSIIKNSILLVLVITGSILKKFSINTIFIYLAISSCISAVIALMNIHHILKQIGKYVTEKIIFSFSIMKNILKFGLPMVPGTIALMILRVSDRYMLTYLSANSLYDVGIYAIGYRIGMIMTFLTSIVSMVYLPYAMKIADKPEAKESYRNIFYYYAIFGGILGFFIIFFSSEIFQIFINKSYFEAVKIVFFGVISNYLHGLFNIVNINFYVKKRSGNIALAVFLGAILNVVLNFILIPIYGIYGAGAASILAFFFIFIFNFFMAEKIYNVGYKIVYVILSLAILLIISSFNFISPINLTISIFKISIFMVIILFLTRYFFRNKPLILGYFKKKLRIS